ncbi:hypothetical protein GCM10023339_20340 [Alloalcanivorax gelatiniphagus]
MFYVFFESILPVFFLLTGLYGSEGKERASFYLFLYTLFGSLFMLLAILTIGSIAGGTHFDLLYKIDLDFSLQLVLFLGLFLAMAIKTPFYGLNS